MSEGCLHPCSGLVREWVQGSAEQLPAYMAKQSCITLLHWTVLVRVWQAKWSHPTWWIHARHVESPDKGLPYLDTNWCYTIPNMLGSSIILCQKWIQPFIQFSHTWKKHMSQSLLNMDFKDLLVLWLSCSTWSLWLALMLLLVLKSCLFSLFNVAECNIHTSPSPGIQVRHVYTPSTTKHFSPIKQSTTLTNKHRGNEVSTTPLLVNCKYPSALLLIIILWSVC